MSKRKKIASSFIFIIFVLSLSLLLTACGGGEGKKKAVDTTTSASVTLSWEAPTTNTDGTQLVNLGGYKIYYGTSSRHYTNVIDVGNVTTYKIKDLPPGIYYFAVTAYNTLRHESDYSNEVSKTP